MPDLRRRLPALRSGLPHRRGTSRLSGTSRRGFPLAAGLLLGLGLGGFFDGIVLHQVLQWHHIVSSRHPVGSVADLERNTLWDGIFHGATYLFVVAGLVILWRAAHRGHLTWSHRLLAGTLLAGWGLFNLVEGLVDHQLLGLHHVNERAPRAQWPVWDAGFLLWGAVMLLVGWRLVRAGRADPAAGRVPPR